MAGNAAKASAPYLGNSTLAKTTLPAFAAISIAYAVFLAFCTLLKPNF